MTVVRITILIILCIFALPGYAQFGVELGGGIGFSKARNLGPINSLPATERKFVKPKTTYIWQLKGFFENKKHWVFSLMIDGGQYKYEINPLDEPKSNKFSHYFFEINFGFEKLLLKKRLGLVAGLQYAYLTHAKYELAEDYRVNIYNPFLVSPGINLGIAWHFKILKEHRFSLVYLWTKSILSNYRIEMVKIDPYEWHTYINYAPALSFNSFSLRYEIYNSK